MTTTADIPDQSTALDITAILKRAAAEKLGLSSFLALLYLHDQGPAKLNLVAAHCGITASAATGTADRLVKLGLVRRECAPGDRRTVLLELSFEGRNAVARILAA